MKAVLKSVSPKVCELIANGKCTVLAEKKVPKFLKPPFKCYIYCTNEEHFAARKENGEWWMGIDEFWLPVKSVALSNRVIGEFVCDKIYDGWHISNLKMYEKPKELYHFLTRDRKTDYLERCPYYHRNCLFYDYADSAEDNGTCLSREGLCSIEKPPKNFRYVDAIYEYPSIKEADI